MNIKPTTFIDNRVDIKENEIETLSHLLDNCIDFERVKSKVNELVNSVKEGSLKELEYLVNIMFHQELKISLYATNQLYSIYDNLDNKIKEDIAEFIQSLYEIKIKEDSEYFKERPLLSAMALGLRVVNETGQVNESFISAIDDYLISKHYDSILKDQKESVGLNNRYISISELQSWVLLNNYQCDISDCGNMIGKLNDEIKINDTKTIKSNIVLVNDNHWITLFFYKENCFLCDSFPLSQKEKNNYDKLIQKEQNNYDELMKKLKLKKFKIIEIKKNLQDNVPNGCGLFALNYVKTLQDELANKPDKNLTSTIKKILQNTRKQFLNKTPAEQSKFGRDFRNELLIATLYRLTSLQY